MRGKVELSRDERHFLRLRYGKRLDDGELVWMAVQEAKRLQAKEVPKKQGYAPVEDEAHEVEG